MRNMRRARAVKHLRNCNNIILEHFLSACEKKAKYHINIKVQIQCNTQSTRITMIKRTSYALGLIQRVLL